MRVVCLLVFLLLPLVSVAQEAMGPRVAVVGAGFSGLTAAYRLTQAGYEVEVFEARERVGGRVRSILLDGEVAELGGQNIYDGGEPLCIRRLAGELGLELHERQLPKALCYADAGQVISIPEYLKSRGWTVNLLEARLAALQGRVSNMQEILLELFPRDPELVITCEALLASFCGGDVLEQTLDNVEDLFPILAAEISPAYSWDEYVLHLGVKGGNECLARTLAENLGDRLHLGHALKSVKRGENGGFALTFESGERACSDLLVLTMPCSVFGEVEFDEEVLPQDRLSGIQSVPYMNASKILLPLDKPLPGRQVTNGHFISYFPGTEAHLSLYYVGPASRLNESNLLQTFEETGEVLHQAYEWAGSGSAPRFLLDETIREVAGPVAVNWLEDRWARGAYSYIANGMEFLMEGSQEVCGQMVRSLFRPVEDRLFFAGEHATINDMAPGTMEGAVESGEGCARLIQSLHPLGEGSPSGRPF